MLQVRGKVLQVEQKTAGPEGQTFQVTEVAVMTGKADVERVRLGRDFRGEPPVEGREVDLCVLVSAFRTRDGAGWRGTAVENLAASTPVKAVG